MEHKKKRYYIIGIAGVAMGNLSGILKAKGYEVAGSDQEMYEPMKSMLTNLKIPVFSPYHIKNIKRYKPDVVVVGNAISRGNSELEYVMSNRILYRSMSDILQEEFIQEKKAIVVTGTHGKTTTSALIAHILESARLDPTVFVGGFMRNIGAGFKLGNGNYIVLEGDEYDTCFFDKNPKFLHYRPFIGVLNNIELDHVDIYKDIFSLEAAFSNFIKLIPKNGLLVVNRENKNAWNLVKKQLSSGQLWKNKSEPKIISFGLKSGDYQISNIKLSHETSFNLNFRKKHIGHISSNLLGNHNISNILAAIAVTRFCGVSPKIIRSASSSFFGVKRRLEVLGEKNGVLFVDDYAHHPTAVRETLLAIRKKFPMKRIIALFEPGSASSKRRIFEKQYIQALSNADHILIYKPFHVEHMNKKEVFSINKVIKSLHGLNKKALAFTDVDKLLFHVKRTMRPGDVVVIMSCRGFDGLREKLFL